MVITVLLAFGFSHGTMVAIFDRDDFWVSVSFVLVNNLR